jgi:hypothetical protein
MGGSIQIVRGIAVEEHLLILGLNRDGDRLNLPQPLLKRLPTFF